MVKSVAAKWSSKEKADRREDKKKRLEGGRKEERHYLGGHEERQRPWMSELLSTN